MTVASKTFVIHPSGARVELRQPPLDAGGEGEIHLIDGRSRIVKLIFHPTPVVIEKLCWMLDHAPPRETPWAPRDLGWPDGLLIRPETNQICGYQTMFFENASTLETVFNRIERVRTFPNWTFAHLVNLAANLARAFERAHRLNLTLGDVSSRNAMCDERTYVKLIDLESAQIDAGKSLLPCLVATTDYTAPELQAVDDFSKVRRTVFHDSFGLAVLVYQLIGDGVHPYYGTVESPGGPKTMPPGMAERVSQNLWAHSSSTAAKPRVTPPPDACDFASMPTQLQDLFHRAFDEGHVNPSRRPAPREFVDALEVMFKTLTRCSVNPKHQFAQGLAKCPWCVRRAATGIESFPA